MKVLITGATGFIGSSVAKVVANDGLFQLSLCSRQGVLSTPDIACYTIDDLNKDTDWKSIVGGQDVVIHTAGVAHQKVRKPSDCDLMTQVNVEGTVHLAQESAQAGVKRFIFISSIGVHGQRSLKPFGPEDQISPVDQYALSKYEAEIALFDISKNTGMEVVIIRPPLVYGPKAPGNFSSLVKLVQKRVPLPFGLIKNKRSFVGIGNLVDLIIRCVDHPDAVGQKLLVSDGVDLSTAEFVRLISRYAAKRSLLVPVPVSVLKFMISLIGKKQLSDKLFSDLQVDSSYTEKVLDWKPPYTIDQGMKQCFDREK
mgnify:CR=1 FL=1